MLTLLTFITMARNHRIDLTDFKIRGHVSRWRRDINGTNNSRAGRRDGAGRSSGDPSNSDTSDNQSRPFDSSRPRHCWTGQSQPTGSPRPRQTKRTCACNSSSNRVFRQNATIIPRVPLVILARDQLDPAAPTVKSRCRPRSACVPTLSGDDQGVKMFGGTA